MSALSPRFRAILRDPGDQAAERPVQILGDDWEEIERWAGLILSKAKSPDAIVQTFEAVEQARKVFTKGVTP